MHVTIYIAPVIYVEEKNLVKLCEIARRHGILYAHSLANESWPFYAGENPSYNVIEVKLYKIDGWPVPYKVWSKFKEDCEKEGVEIF